MFQIFTNPKYVFLLQAKDMSTTLISFQSAFNELSPILLADPGLMAAVRTQFNMMKRFVDRQPSQGMTTKLVYGGQTYKIEYRK